MALTFRKRIICHFDSLSLQPTDLQTICNTVSSSNIGVTSWLLPCRELQRHVHQRFMVEEVAYDDDNEPYGLMTIVSSQFTPVKVKKSVFDVFFQRPAVSQVILKTSVIDRQHWHRTSWCFRSVLKDKEWGDFPAKIYGLDVQSDPVTIDAAFNKEANVFDKYKVEIPNDGFRTELQDTGKGLLDPSIRTTDGFVDNESALRVIAMHRETISRGHEGVLFRQPVWTSPVVPNIAKLVDFSPGKSVCSLFDIPEDRFPKTPVASWLLESIPNTYVFQCESMIEDENDPSANWTELGEKPFHDRIQKRTMNRYEDFKNEVRSKAYEELAAERMSSGGGGGGSGP